MIMVIVMAKRKKSKETSNIGMSTELTGLFLAIIGIIGFGFGHVGTIIKEFAMFLFGSWWLIFVIYLLVTGLYMLFKRKMPKFFSSKLIGLYLIILVVLVASHFTFLNKIGTPGGIISETVNRYMDRIGTIDLTDSILNTGDTTLAIGGGIVGAVFISALYFLFARVGTIIVLVVMAIFGIIMLFNITLSDLIDGFKKFVNKNKKDSEDDDDVEELPNLAEISETVSNNNLNDLKEKEEIKENVVVRSLDEVKNKSEDIKEIVNIEPEVIPEVEDEPILSEKYSSYKLPSLNLLNEVKKDKKTGLDAYTLNNKDVLEKVLKDFQITAKVVDIHVGPAVTQYEIVVPAGTKVSRILSINKEIALALAAKDVRIEAPIPGKSTIGIEIPNQNISAVSFREILEANYALKDKYDIMITLGKNLMGKPIVADMAKMPHLLVAGSTGSGKSVCINSIICSILMNYNPSDVKLIMVDPKKVELTNYNGTPHLLCPVVNDPKKASIMLQNVVREMEKRYDIFAEAGVKKISEYNNYIEKENRKNPDSPLPKMPYMVVIIDELADLMLVASKEVEDSIMRITQMARAAGIHLIVATQRPSTDVITGVVKANIPSRICFAVASSIDSRTALDMTGAEKLLGKGDMLYLPMGENTPERIQGCYISDDEINRLINYCSKQLKASYEEGMTLTQAQSNTSSGSGNGDDDYDDPMYNEIVEFAMQTGKISASLIQRKFRFGFNRAARMIDLLEARGIVGPQNGSKPREVLKKDEEE